MSLFQITRAERAVWQRRAVTELATAPADQVWASFQTWQRALDIGEHTETPSGSGVAYLHAVTHRNRVRVGLATTVFDHDGGHR